MSSKNQPNDKTRNLLQYHRRRRKVPLDPKKAERDLAGVGNLGVLTVESRRCLQTLAAYRAPKSQIPFPRSRCAAVLVALFVGRKGDLYVLLSRRSATLRTYAGDTSLPGGKVDPQDRSLEDTARREAFEEIGLPRDRRKAPLLCTLEPFLAGNQLIVTPIVVLILDNTLQPILNHSEVTSLFSHPLASFISTTPPYPTEPEMIEVEYHTYFDHDWDGPPLYISNRHGEAEILQTRQVRMHRFMTGREAGGIKPVFGLTAAMLIHTARIGFKKDPDFEVNPPSAPTMEQRLAWAAVKPGSLIKEALNEERARVDWAKLQKLAGLDENSDSSRAFLSRAAKPRPSPWGNVIWRTADHKRGRTYKSKL
ncbi:8-oxo-dGTP diphosphatase [Marasmius crinis-equi]|uniref:8-oxo-dGTP diphosphatase n=1 Tax=Marasmius crinis-equi TaxID=585013 RepID=A0ABR3G119_9AGAR